MPENWEFSGAGCGAGTPVLSAEKCPTIITATGETSRMHNTDITNFIQAMLNFMGKHKDDTAMRAISLSGQPVHINPSDVMTAFDSKTGDQIWPK